MKLVRFGEFRNEKPAILTEDGKRRDCSAHFTDWNRDFFIDDGLKKLAEIDTNSLPIVDENVRWGSCVTRPGKVVCIAANYADHAKEGGSTVPDEPKIFLKSTTAVVGPYDTIMIPPGSEDTDYEIELAIVIGRDASYLESEQVVKEYIAGYCIANDVSERNFQKNHAGQFTKGKSCDTFCPLGPFMLTPEQTDPEKLAMKLQINGETMQDSCTRYMVFKPAFLVYYISQFMTLEAGDVISTGTPAGVGGARNPKIFLKDGDELILEIEQLGTQRNTCKQT